MMKRKCILFFIIFIGGVVIAQDTASTKIERVSAGFTRFNYSRTYHLKDANQFSIQVDFKTARKLSLGINAFYRANQVLPPVYNLPQKLYPQETYVYEGEFRSSFAGSQLGVGATIYYKLFHHERLTISPALSGSLSFFQKASADVSRARVFRDSTSSYVVIERIRSEDNVDKLRDAKPDIFLLNLSTRFQFVLVSPIIIFAEPFVSIGGIHKYDFQLASTTGATFGLAWKL